MKVMWSDVQTRVGTPHKALEQLGVGTPHKISVQENPYGRVGGWPVLSGYNTTTWLHLASWNLQDSHLS